MRWMETKEKKEDMKETERKIERMKEKKKKSFVSF